MLSTLGLDILKFQNDRWFVRVSINLYLHSWVSWNGDVVRWFWVLIGFFFFSWLLHHWCFFSDVDQSDHFGIYVSLTLTYSTVAMWRTWKWLGMTWIDPIITSYQQIRDKLRNFDEWCPIFQKSGWRQNSDWKYRGYTTLVHLGSGSLTGANSHCKYKVRHVLQPIKNVDKITFTSDIFLCVVSPPTKLRATPVRLVPYTAGLQPPRRYPRFWGFAKYAIANARSHPITENENSVAASSICILITF